MLIENLKIYQGLVFLLMGGRVTRGSIWVHRSGETPKEEGNHRAEGRDSASTCPTQTGEIAQKEGVRRATVAGQAETVQSPFRQLVCIVVIRALWVLTFIIHYSVGQLLAA